jgi:predicted MFS family arabinose efflux permease
MGLGIAALAPLFMFIIFRVTRPEQEASHPQNEPRSTRPLPPLYWIYWLSIVLAVATEFCMISWSAVYLETILKIPKADAAQAVSFIFISLPYK